MVVLAGGSLAKLGMKFQGHVKHAMPIVEDVLAGFAAHVARDDGVSPILRLDASDGTRSASGSAPLAVVKALYTEPLGARRGSRCSTSIASRSSCTTPRRPSRPAAATSR